MSADREATIRARYDGSGIIKSVNPDVLWLLDKLAAARERDGWLVRQLDNCIADAKALEAACLDGKGIRALAGDLRDARAALAADGERT